MKYGKILFSHSRKLTRRIFLKKKLTKNKRATKQQKKKRKKKHNKTGKNK